MTGLRDRVVSACRGAVVAAAAGVAEATWSSATVPRVFGTGGGLVGQRNRGRCPFVEVALEYGPQNHDRPGGGASAVICRLFVWVNDRDEATAHDRARVIAAACADAIAALDDAPAITPGPQDWGRVPVGFRLEWPLSIPVSWQFGA
jgi:hypothetical protein